MVKTKKLLSAVLTAILICIASGMAVTASAAGTITPTKPTGDGTSSSPYQISNEGELYWFAGLVNGTLTDGTEQDDSAVAKLTADITVDSYLRNLFEYDTVDTTWITNSDDFIAWTPIGSNGQIFYGTFDGQGHTIRGLYFNDSETNNVGLIGKSNGMIMNVGIAGSYFNGADYVGGICGYNAGTVTGCYSAALVSGTTENVGGVCGYHDTYGSLNNVVSNKSIYSGNAVGGNQSTSYPTAYAKTTAQFASGEVAYLLNGSTSEGDNLVWGQTLTGDNKDAYPVSHTASNTVYATTGCVTYTNTQPTTAEKSHSEFYAIHKICPDCGFCEEATFTDNKYDINGDDVKDEVYEISSASQLYWFAGLVNGTLTDGTVKNKNANAVLTADITVNSDLLNSLEYDTVNTTLITNGDDFIAWTPIGTDAPISRETKQYGGTFDGQGYQISGLYVYSSKAYVGLFGVIGINGKVLNLGVTDSYFRGGDEVGGICGKNIGMITKCYNFSEIAGGYNIGGICGWNYCGTITNCYNIAKITSGDTAGGICGFANGESGEAFSIAKITGSESVRGIFGLANGGNNGTITNCYSSAEFIGGDFAVGGICGCNRGNALIENNYYNSSIYSGECIGDGTITYTNNPAKTTAQFASGEVAYLLNESKSTGENLVWGQTLTGDNADQYPVFHNASNTVYATTGCVTYTNDSTLSGIEKEHGEFSDDGFCPDCGNVYQQATWNDVTNQYEISNAGQLYWFAGLVNGTLTDGTAKDTSANAVLTADITINKNVLNAETNQLNSGNYKQWTPIGDVTNKYSGTFNGQGHTISGLYCNVDLEYVGLFGYLDSNGTIKNVGVADSYFNSTYRSGSYIGGVCGYSMGTINSCYASIKVNNNFGPSCAIAFSGGGTLTNCCNNSDFCDNIYLDEGKSTIENNSGITTAEFASGAATWLLNGNSSEGVWKQTLTGDKPDAYPTFEGKTVYQQASGNTYANSLITTATNTAGAPSFDASTTMYDKDGKTATDFVYDENADVTTVYVKIDGAEAGVKPIIKITGGNGDVESQTWTAVNNIYYAQFIGDFADFGTIEVTYEGADSVTIPTTTSTEEEL